MSIPDFRFGDLDGRTLLITGITTGIGRAMLPGLLAQGLRLIAVSKGSAEMEAVRAEIGANEEQLRLYECDLADPAQVNATAASILASGTSLDGILHNAAIDPRERFEQADDLFWQRVMQVNLFAAVSLTRQLLPVLRQSPQGRVIFTGSVISEIGGACLTAYAASKGAVLGVTRSLAHELQGTNITVNCTIPGAIRVEKEPDGVDEKLIGWQTIPRRLTPDDLLGLTCFLLSKWGGGITGQAITVDGGILHPLASPEVQGGGIGIRE